MSLLSQESKAKVKLRMSVNNKDILLYNWLISHLRLEQSFELKISNTCLISV